MTEESELDLEFSELGQELTSDGKTVKVEIYRFEGDQRWCLEVSDEFDNSSVWEDTFATAQEAVDEVKTAIAEESIDAFIGPANGKSECDWK